MEDVLDEWNTARLKFQIMGVDDDESVVVPHDQKKKKVCSCLPTSFFGVKHVFLRRDIALKIKDINERLDDIAKQKDMFNLNVQLIKGNPGKLEQVGTISSIDVSEISGRDIEKNALISMLVGKSNVEPNDLHIISLVGMGGIGKTTLAQLVYNDDEIKQNFSQRIWVCVSEPFDDLRIARTITEALQGSALNLQEFQSLMQQIENLIREKKFLLVLDDVWNENYNRWAPFYNCLKNGKQGSKILITTRKETVARTMRSTDIVPVKELHEKECWSIFKRLAFFNRSSEECEKLEETGRKIVRKCKGLPLAVKIMGSLLCSKKTEQEWKIILNSEMWEIEELKQGLIAPLLLSYNDLPSMVKRCFQFCAIFPKDYKLEKDELIKLWMAQGYLHIKGNQEMEMIGEVSFNILATRSFFQEFEKDNDVILCKMHDIVQDFAEYLSEDECFVLEVNSGDESFKESSSDKVRHLMLNFGVGMQFPIYIYRAKKLRSLLISQENSWEIAYFSSSINVPLELFSKLTCLRALRTTSAVIWQSLTEEVPREMGKLIHLRYLNLNGQKIKKLPETICELYNLQTLCIRGCYFLEELPQRIGKLINLRHLLNFGTGRLNYMPSGIARLTDLRTLEKLIVGGDRGGDVSKTCTLESLKDLNFLQQCDIHRLGDVRDVGEAKRCQLEKKKNLLALLLDFSSEYEVGRSKNEEDKQVLEGLQLPPNLKKLRIWSYRGNTLFSNWLMSFNQSKGCSNCEHLPPLGKLPSIEKLEIYYFTSVKRVGNEFLGILKSDHHHHPHHYHHGSSPSSFSSVIAFPKLKYLEFRGMDEWEEWEYEDITGKEDIIIMPRLFSLVLPYCPKLKTLPYKLLQKTPLQELTVYGCPILESTVDRSKLSHIPQVNFLKIGP